MNIGSMAVAATMAVVMFHTGLLFYPHLFRKQFNCGNLRRFGSLATANYVVIPVVTLGAVWLFSFSPVLNVVLLTLALLPGAPLVPVMAAMSGEPPEWALFTFLCLSLLNLALLPVLVMVLAMPWAGGNVAHLDNGAHALVGYVFSVYGPMSLGVAIRIFAPRQFPFWSKLMSRALPASTLAVFALFLFLHYQELLSLGAREFGALALFEAICITVGVMMKQGDAESRVTTILTCTLRNFAMGISFTSIVFPQTAATAYMMTFTNVILISAFIGLGISKRVWRRKPILHFKKGGN